MSHAEHEWAREQIAAFLAGGLSAEERARLEAHITACAECIAELDGARRFEASMEALFVPVRPKPGLEDRVIRGLRSRPVRQAWAPPKALMWIAATLLLGVMGFVILEMESSRSPSPAAPGEPVMAGFYFQEGVAPEASRPGKGGGGSAAGSYGNRDRLQAMREKSVETKTVLRAAEESGRLAPETESLLAAREDSTRAESADDADFAKGKGDSLGFAADKPMHGKSGVYRLPVPQVALVPAAPPPTADPMARANEGKEAYYKFNDAAPPVPAGQAQQAGEVLVLARTAPENRREELEELKKLEKDLQDDVKRVQAEPKADAPPQEGQQKAQAEPAKAQVQPPPATQRKIIRSGEMEFEIDGFDNAVARVTQIAGEEGGFIQTVSSDRLANGKVRGVVVVRVPPERVDTLLLKLRALGDLKSSQIGSQDVTKQYYDLESRLRAARTMEERLLRIIKEGKGEIKDLLLAEKELGEWRTRIEQFEGEIRYYNSMISLSTITLTLTEKDIRSASAVVRIEHVEMGLEVEDVEKAHRAALEAVAESKGRVTRSELKQHAAGQFNAIVEFEVAPGSSGPLRDRLKQLGTLSRLEVNTQEQTEGGGPVKGSDVRVTQKDSRFSVSIYNLANLAPRETVHLNLASTEAEETYKAIVARIEKAGGRIVSSQLNRQKNDQTTGMIHAEVKTPEAEAVLLDVRAAGEVMRLQIVEAADAAQATKSKRGFRIQIFALGAVAPRETTTLRIASADVPAAFKALLEAARQGGGRIIVSQLQQGDRRHVNARLDFDVRRPADAAIETALGSAGEPLSRVVHRVEDNENVVDSKVRYTMTLVDLGMLQARETTTLQLAVKNVPEAYRALMEAVRKAAGWIHVSTMNETDRQNVTASLTFDVKREQESAVVAALGSAGITYTRAVQRAPEGSDAADSKLRFAAAIFDLAKVPPREMHTIALEASRVDESVKALEAAAVDLKGRVLDRTDARDSATGRQTSTVVLEVPLAASSGILQRIKDLGLSIRSREAHKNPQVPEGELAKAQLSITVTNDLLLAPDSGPWTNIKRGLSVSLTAGSYALMLIMIGVCFILPLALLVWGGVRVYRRMKPKAA